MQMSLTSSLALEKVLALFVVVYVKLVNKICFKKYHLSVLDLTILRHLNNVRKLTASVTYCGQNIASLQFVKLVQ